jgi:flagellar motor switch protein FliN/FliY
MTTPSPAGFNAGVAESPEGGLAEAAAAAAALVAVLPAGGQLSPGPPTRDRPTPPAGSQAACAHFGGAATGEIVVVVGADLIDALKASPMGELDPAKALHPALEAAVSPFGPVVVEPAVVLGADDALTAMAATGQAVYVPLLQGEEVRGVLAIVAGTPETAATAGTAAAAPAAAAGTAATVIAGRAGLDLLHDVEMEVTAELGRTRMTVRELLSLSPGTIVELDRAAGSPADLLVNGRLLASGEVVIIDENFGLRITQIIASGERS